MYSRIWRRNLTQKELQIDSSMLGNTHSDGNGGLLPSPLAGYYNVNSPALVVADITKNGSKTACVRWFGEVLGNEKANKSLRDMQFLFPLLLNPYDEELFPPGPHNEFIKCQVLSLDSKENRWVSEFSKERNLDHDEIQMACYGDNLLIIHAGIVKLAFPSFGVIQPKLYIDPARESQVKRIEVRSKVLEPQT